MEDSRIPIVDLKISTSNSISKDDETFSETACEEIENALSKVGFVYLVNHGVPSEKVRKAFEVSKLFFQLPDVVKKKYQKNGQSQYHGYSEPGQELLNDSSRYELRETFDIPVIRKDLFPEDEVPGFKETLLDLQLSCHPLIRKLHMVLAKALKLENANFFNENAMWMKDESVPSLSAFRTLHYPRIPEGAAVPVGTVRCAEHTDYGTLTLLFQDEIGGLEVKRADGRWTKATPVPNSILVNTGDLLEFWTGGYFPATAHRVLIPEEELKKRIPRQSVAYFVHPDNTAMIAPIYNKSNDVANDKYKPVNAAEHALRKFDVTYRF